MGENSREERKEYDSEKHYIGQSRPVFTPVKRRWR
jgi:hypothetical protein